MENSIIFGALAAIFVVLLSYVYKTYLGRAKVQVDDNGSRNNDNENRKPVKKEVTKTKKKVTDQRWSSRSKQQQFAHPWHLTTFKGHTGTVLDLDFSTNGKYLATCSDDRTVFLWDAKDFHQKDHKSVRVNVEFDHPVFVKWSPDNKAFLIQRYQDNNIEVYKVEKKKDGGLGHASVAHAFPKSSDEEIIALSIASSGKFIMTCSSSNYLTLWDLKGQVLTKLDTCLMTTYCAKISPCGSFIYASGFAPDVKVWEVQFSKNGSFDDAKRAFELTGHKSGIYDVTCNADCSQMATVSKDGTWKIFDTKVEFKKGQDPRLYVTGDYKTSDNARIALSPNGVVVIAVDSTLLFYASFSATLDYKIENIYDGDITRVLFDASGRFLLTAGPRHVHVFHNVTGYKCEIRDAEMKLKENQTSATKERLRQIIKDNQLFLANIPA